MFIPSATSRGLSEYLWRIEQVSHAVANGYYVGTINRVGIESEIGDDDFYGQSYFVDPRGQFVGDVGSSQDEELIVRDLDLDKIAEVRNTWQFYRDRRPDAYADLGRALASTAAQRHAAASDAAASGIIRAVGAWGTAAVAALGPNPSSAGRCSSASPSSPTTRSSERSH